MLGFLGEHFGLRGHSALLWAAVELSDAWLFYTLGVLLVAVSRTRALLVWGICLGP